MKTTLCDRLSIELPIIQAPMGGGVVGPTLAAAVSNAGGLGMLVPWRADLATVRRQIQETRALTSKPFGVNLNLEFPQEERLEAALDEGVRIVSFFWRDPAALSRAPRSRGESSFTPWDRPRMRDAPRIVVSMSLSLRVGRQAATSEVRWRQCRSFPP